LHPVPPFD
jgi:chromosome segregation ATPase